jgi:hypothetical protein
MEYEDDDDKECEFLGYNLHCMSCYKESNTKFKGNV